MFLVHTLSGKTHIIYIFKRKWLNQRCDNVLSLGSIKKYKSRINQHRVQVDLQKLHACGDYFLRHVLYSLQIVTENAKQVDGSIQEDSERFNIIKGLKEEKTLKILT